MVRKACLTMGPSSGNLHRFSQFALRLLVQRARRNLVRKFWLLGVLFLCETRKASNVFLSAVLSPNRWGCILAMVLLHQTCRFHLRRWCSPWPFGPFFFSSNSSAGSKWPRRYAIMGALQSSLRMALICFFFFCLIEGLVIYS